MVYLLVKKTIFEFFQFLLKTSAAFLDLALSQLIAKAAFISALQASQLGIWHTIVFPFLAVAC